MLRLLTSAQLQEADKVTIEKRHLSSENLMEVASKAFVKEFMLICRNKETRISIYCGTGNNGGDGLAIARLLKEEGYPDVHAKIARFNPKVSPDFKTNFHRARLASVQLTTLSSTEPIHEEADLIIDALLGSGLNRALTGDWKKLVKELNSLGKRVVSVDVPTGFKTEGPVSDRNMILKCQTVITFQLPKINFFLPEAALAMDKFIVADIGLDAEFLAVQTGHFQLVTRQAIRQILQPRSGFSHKGSYGHTLIVAGKAETMGAAILCAGASVYAGSGRTTALIPQGGLVAMNAVFPEVMIGLRDKKEIDTDLYTAVVAGPGMGTAADSVKLITALVKQQKPLILDADALNILSEHPALLSGIPEQTVITPHMKEFDRLFGDHKNWWDRLNTAREKAKELKVIIVLKNRYTFTVTPKKEVFINPTGSPAMASGGMGDVLAGVIGALRSQGYSASESAIAGVYIHGSCGETDDYVVTASALIRKLPVKMGELVNR